MHSQIDGFVMASDVGVAVRAPQDVADALSACFGTRGLILTEQELGADFFRLQSGLAGELFQKFVNYRMPLAIVVPDFAAHGPRFQELAREHSDHQIVRCVHSLEDAMAWLSSLA